MSSRNVFGSHELIVAEKIYGRFLKTQVESFLFLLNVEHQNVQDCVLEKMKNVPDYFS